MSLLISKQRLSPEKFIPTTLGPKRQGSTSLPVGTRSYTIQFKTKITLCTFCQISMNPKMLKYLASEKARSIAATKIYEEINKNILNSTNIIKNHHC